mmetsp:Transcript_68196/g.177477  ORF Transcript_68196/g.177477 Transcript_68196/m.177477 type:complete len:257 (+) Transcript_68196:270-1040(+)
MCACSWATPACAARSTSALRARAADMMSCTSASPEVLRPSARPRASCAAATFADTSASSSPAFCARSFWTWSWIALNRAAVEAPRLLTLPRSPVRLFEPSRSSSSRCLRMAASCSRALRSAFAAAKPVLAWPRALAAARAVASVCRSKSRHHADVSASWPADAVESVAERRFHRAFRPERLGLARASCSSDPLPRLWAYCSSSRLAAPTASAFSAVAPAAASAGAAGEGNSGASAGTVSSAAGSSMSEVGIGGSAG